MTWNKYPETKPQPGQRVLAFITGNYDHLHQSYSSPMEVATYDSEYGFCPDHFCELSSYGEASHWMTLPEVPNE